MKMATTLSAITCVEAAKCSLVSASCKVYNIIYGDPVQKTVVVGEVWSIIWANNDDYAMFCCTSMPSVQTESMPDGDINLI